MWASLASCVLQALFVHNFALFSRSSSQRQFTVIILRSTLIKIPDPFPNCRTNNSTRTYSTGSHKGIENTQNK